MSAKNEAQIRAIREGLEAIVEQLRDIEKTWGEMPSEAKAEFELDPKTLDTLPWTPYNKGLGRVSNVFGSSSNSAFASDGISPHVFSMSLSCSTMASNPSLIARICASFFALTFSPPIFCVSYHSLFDSLISCQHLWQIGSLSLVMYTAMSVFSHGFQGFKHFSFCLAFTEEEVWKRFEAWLNLYAKKTFSSDTLREFGLHKLLRDPKHQIGAIFQTKLLQGRITVVARTRSVIPSNHGREIRVYKLTR